MRVLRDEFFIRKDFAFYDSGICAVVSLQLIHIYDLIRRFTYRGQAQDPEMAGLRKGGYVVSSVGQSKLAALSGVSRKTVNEHVARMKELGWVRIQPREDRQGAYYVVGQLLTDANGNPHEVFLADAWMHKLWTHMEDRCCEEFGDMPILKTTPSWRIGVVEAFLGACETPEHPVGCNASVTGVVTPARQGLSRGGDTEEENSEVENSEVEKGEGPVAPLPPSPLSSAGLVNKRSARKFAGKLKVPRGVAHSPTVPTPAPSFESGEYPSAAPSAPQPKWMKAVGDDTEPAKAPVHMDAPATKRALRPPRVPEHLKTVVEEATKQSKKSAEKQLQKAKSKETKLASLGGKPVPVTRKRTLQTLENKWREVMKAKFDGVTIASWEAKERGQVWNLVSKYSGEIVGNALHYLVEQWDEIRTRMLKGRGGVPSVGFLLRFHDVLVVESQMWTEYRHVKKQVDEWYGDDLYKPDPPAELNDRYIKLRKEMADLGLPV